MDSALDINSEHSVIIYFRYGKEDDTPFYDLANALLRVVSESNAGIYDGHEIAMDNSEGSFYLYGPNAELLFKVVKPMLEGIDFMKGAIAHLRFGRHADAPELEIEIGKG